MMIEILKQLLDIYSEAKVADYIRYLMGQSAYAQQVFHTYMDFTGVSVCLISVADRTERLSSSQKINFNKMLLDIPFDYWLRQLLSQVSKLSQPSQIMACLMEHQNNIAEMKSTFDTFLAENNSSS